jgi:hypothetical protein
MFAFSKLCHMRMNGRAGHYALRAAQLRIANPAIWDVVSESVKEKADQMDEKDVLRVLRAFIILNDVDDEVLIRLATRAARLAKQLKISEISSLCYAFSEHRAMHAHFFAAMSIAFQLKIATATPSDFAQMAVAFARLRLADHSLLGNTVYGYTNTHGFKYEIQCNAATFEEFSLKVLAMRRCRPDWYGGFSVDWAPATL